MHTLTSTTPYAHTHQYPVCALTARMACTMELDESGGIATSMRPCTLLIDAQSGPRDWAVGRPPWGQGGSGLRCVWHGMVAWWRGGSLGCCVNCGCARE